MDKPSAFEQQRHENIRGLGADHELQQASFAWMNSVAKHKYSYNFNWLGRPIIQFPQDIVAMQEILWSVKPDLVIETGIAHGGSLIFTASILELNAVCGGPPHARVLGIDVDIRAPNRKAIESHPLSKRIRMVEGSSVSTAVVSQVKEEAKSSKTVLVCLDSNHTHEHVLAELEAYAPLVSTGSYCVVFDTAIEDMPEGVFTDRPWRKGDNPKTAVWEYLKDHPEFVIDASVQHRLLITVAPDGYLKRVS